MFYMIQLQYKEENILFCCYTAEWRVFMKLSKIKKLLDAKIETTLKTDDVEIMSACGSDLMSDVLAFVKEQGILLTGLVNPQVIRTAEMMDIRAIVFVRGKNPDEDMIKLAEERDIVLMSTEVPMFVACGILYSNGLVPAKRV